MDRGRATDTRQSRHASSRASVTSEPARARGASGGGAREKGEGERGDTSLIRLLVRSIRPVGPASCRAVPCRARGGEIAKSRTRIKDHKPCPVASLLVPRRGTPVLPNRIHHNWHEKTCACTSGDCGTDGGWRGREREGDGAERQRRRASVSTRSGVQRLGAENSGNFEI
jgi:hypothetical protein